MKTWTGGCLVSSEQSQNIKEPTQFHVSFLKLKNSFLRMKKWTGGYPVSSELSEAKSKHKRSNLVSCFILKTKKQLYKDENMDRRAPRKLRAKSKHKRSNLVSCFIVKTKKQLFKDENMDRRVPCKLRAKSKH